MLHKQEFPWPNYYGNFNFFEDRMNHNRVRTLNNLCNGRYDIVRDTGEVLRIFICDCYSFGVAEYIETKSKLGKLDAIIINSCWCGYTLEAKHHCRLQEVGLFTMADFMAALNMQDPWTYLHESDKKLFKKNGWL
jgi:hypothetical protein